MKQQQRIHPDENRLPADAIPAAKAAQRLKCHIAKIHRWILNGVIPGWLVKGAHKRMWYVSTADLDARVERYIPPVGPIPETRAGRAENDAATLRYLKEELGWEPPKR